jgi:phage tail sheath protein FI
MPEYLAPGVFMEEVSSGSKPIEGVGTNTTAFIGYAKSGDFNTPTFIANWTQFCQIFGEEENAYLKALSDETGMSAAEILAGKKASRKGWAEFAQSVITQALATKDGPSVSVHNYQEFLRKHNIPQSGLPYLEGSYLAHAVKGYYDNGGGRAYIVRIARADDIKAVKHKPAGAKRNFSGTPAVTAQRTIGPLTFRALKAGEAGNQIQIDIESVGENGEFRLKIHGGDKPESYGYGKDAPLTLGTVAEVVNAKSTVVQVEVKEVAPEFKIEPLKMAPLENGVDAEVAESNDQAALMALSSMGSNILHLAPKDFIGDESQRTGMSGLASVYNIDLICAPDLMADLWQRQRLPGMDSDTVAPETLAIDDARRKAILDDQCKLVAFCERPGVRSMAILDPIPGVKPDEMRRLTLATPYNCDKGQAAIYYPWIKVRDPLSRGQQIFVPPCGHIAGVYARVAVERGVHKAPANEALLGAVALEVDVTKAEQEILNPDGINCIRAFPGMGIRVWGARTLATVVDPEWKYVNVRRLFNYLERSMERGLQWAVFEPNDHDLWGRVRRNLSAFLFTEWKEGKLFGATADEAFFVKCDEETNPKEMIDLGRLYVHVGLAPVKPAEFVIVRIGQSATGGTVEELSGR